MANSQGWYMVRPCLEAVWSIMLWPNWYSTLVHHVLNMWAWTENMVLLDSGLLEEWSSQRNKPSLPSWPQMSHHFVQTLMHNEAAAFKPFIHPAHSWLLPMAAALQGVRQISLSHHWFLKILLIAVAKTGTQDLPLTKQVLCWCIIDPSQFIMNPMPWRRLSHWSTYFSIILPTTHPHKKRKEKKRRDLREFPNTQAWRWNQRQSRRLRVFQAHKRQHYPPLPCNLKILCFLGIHGESLVCTWWKILPLLGTTSSGNKRHQNAITALIIYLLKKSAWLLLDNEEEDSVPSFAFTSWTQLELNSQSLILRAIPQGHSAHYAECSARILVHTNFWQGDVFIFFWMLLSVKSSMHVNIAVRERLMLNLPLCRVRLLHGRYFYTQESSQENTTHSPMVWNGTGPNAIICDNWLPCGRFQGLDQQM